MTIEEWVEADLARARRRVWMRRLGSLLTDAPGFGRMIRFEEARENPGAFGGAHIGWSVVCSEDVMGSIDRRPGLDTRLPR
jgi:hypothetical protein